MTKRRLHLLISISAARAERRRNFTGRSVQTKATKRGASSELRGPDQVIQTAPPGEMRRAYPEVFCWQEAATQHKGQDGGHETIGCLPSRVSTVR